MLDPELNNILKEMWRLDEKKIAGETWSDSEKEFFASHLSTIQEYYAASNAYWGNKESF